MAKIKTQFVCQQCGRVALRQMGRCPQCGTYNSMVEQIVAEPRKGGDRRPAGAVTSAPRRLNQIEGDVESRLFLPIQEFSRVLGGGIVPGSLVLVGGDPGIGKCVTEDTRVLDPTTGDYLPITAWQKERRPIVSVDTASLRLSPSPVSGFHPQGQQAVVRVTTRLGRQLRCTPSHPVLTETGWKPIGQLQCGDRLASPRCLPFFGNEPMPEVEIKLLAHIVSEGSTQSSITVTTGLPEVIADLETIAAAFGMQLTRYPKRGSMAVQYRFTNNLNDRWEARAELASALRRAQQQRRLSWAEWARRANVSYGILNARKKGE
jgi:replicative DNA helicase